eukprot:c9462_g1_i2.p1 GENE.c9462_g1_i2~~c9462_g1_i2.p1  ORF type:complete len:348 (+),score=104.24 c9462_g1_i2:44-1087(+)
MRNKGKQKGVDLENAAADFMTNMLRLTEDAISGLAHNPPNPLKKVLAHPETVGSLTQKELTSLLTQIEAELGNAQTRTQNLVLMMSTGKDEIEATTNRSNVLLAQAEFEVNESGGLQECTLTLLSDLIANSTRESITDYVGRLTSVLQRHRANLVKELEKLDTPSPTPDTTPVASTRRASGASQRASKRAKTNHTATATAVPAQPPPPHVSNVPVVTPEATAVAYGPPTSGNHMTQLKSASMVDMWLSAPSDGGDLENREKEEEEDDDDDDDNEEAEEEEEEKFDAHQVAGASIQYPHSFEGAAVASHEMTGHGAAQESAENDDNDGDGSEVSSSSDEIYTIPQPTA